MKTTRWLLGALLVGGFLAQGCGGSAQYQIPNVEPVVKQNKAADDDLLEELGGDDPKPSTDAKPAEGGDAKPAESAPEASKPAPEKPATKK